MKQYILLAAFLLFTAPVMAASKVDVTLAGGSGTCVDGVKGEVCRHIFAGQEMIVRADQPGEGACDELRAEVFQVSTKLEMPLGDNALRKQENADCRHREFGFTAPAVKAETEFFVRLQSRETDGEWKNLEDVSVMVYPETLLDRVRSWAADKKNALVLKDKQGDLQAFFDNRKIDYYPETLMPRDAVVAAITVGEPEVNENPAFNTLYLEERTKGMPALRAFEKDGRVTVRAQFKLLPGLKAGDPLAEKEFAELFGLIAK